VGASVSGGGGGAARFFGADRERLRRVYLPPIHSNCPFSPVDGQAVGAWYSGVCSVSKLFAAVVWLCRVECSGGGPVHVPAKNGLRRGTANTIHPFHLLDALPHTHALHTHAHETRRHENLNAHTRSFPFPVKSRTSSSVRPRTAATRRPAARTKSIVDRSCSPAARTHTHTHTRTHAHTHKHATVCCVQRSAPSPAPRR
jgi:hypothetical protein